MATRPMPARKLPWNESLTFDTRFNSGKIDRRFQWPGRPRWPCQEILVDPIAIHPAYAARLGLPVRTTDVDAQEIDGNLRKGHSRVVAPGQAGKGLILQETCLVADTRVEVVLGIPFLTLSIAFIDEELVWRTYTAAEALKTTKRVELFRVKEFVAAALGQYDEAWWCMWHPSGARPRRPRMFILFRQIASLDPFLQTLRLCYPSTPA